ncbi:hypothetical protein [Arthrobacter sp. N1]|uniref:hypothetical protein n=1 Tax=Arthrobacter sp. N1 TaxID=619291 RepID=UPI003BAE88E1
MRRLKSLDVDTSDVRFVPWPAKLGRLLRVSHYRYLAGLLLAVAASLAMAGLGVPVSPSTLLLLGIGIGMAMRATARMKGRGGARRH